MQTETAATKSSIILIVEDEPKMASLLTDYLHAAGHRTHWIENGLQAIAFLHQHKPDLVLLDIMLPGQDGIAVCKELRRFSDIPIIMLTARAEEADRLLGLDAGADDYICKTPFSPREVVARVHALLRRTSGSMRIQTEQARQGLSLDDELHRATFKGTPLLLTPVEYRLLKTLADTPGRVFSRDTLLNRLHPDQRAITDRAIDTHIKNLRRKLLAVSSQNLQIHSVYGVGYRFEWSEPSP